MNNTDIINTVNSENSVNTVNFVNTLTITTKIELKKLMSKTKNKVMLVIIALVSLSVSLFSKGGFSIIIAGVSLNFYNGAFMVLEVLNSVILPLTMFMLCADIISHEFSDYTIKAGLLRPVDKNVLFLSKWLSTVIFGVFCLSVWLVFGGIISVILKQTNILSAVVVFLVSIFPLCAAAGMSALLATAISSPALAMFLSIVLYIVLNCAGFLYSFLGVIFYTAHMNWYKMFLGSLASMPILNVLNTFFMLTAYIVLFLTAGNLIFSKKKI